MQRSTARPTPVVREPKPGRKGSQGAETITAKLFLASGTAFVAVGLVDLALLWTPFRFGTPAWEFATLSQTFSSLPFTGLGLVLAAVGIVRHPSTRTVWVRVAAIVFGVIALALVVLDFLYITVAPGIVRGTPTDGLDVVGTTLIKNGTEMLVYPIAFGVMSFFLWREAKRRG